MACPELRERQADLAILVVMVILVPPVWREHLEIREMLDYLGPLLWGHQERPDDLACLGQLDRRGMLADLVTTEILVLLERTEPWVPQDALARLE